MAFGGPSIYYANRLLKVAFGDDHTADFPASWWLAYLIDPPLADGTGSSEPNPTYGYVRMELPNDSTNWLVPSDDGAVSNLLQIQFPVATGLWGVPAWYGIYDSSTIDAGNAIAVNPIPSPITIDDDIAPYFDIGDIVITCGNLAS